MQFVRWLWSDPETMAAVGGPIHLTNDQAQRRYARMIDPGSPTDCYRLIPNGEDRPVGETSFHRLDRDNMVAEFNIEIASTERGKGYVRAAMLLFLDCFSNRLRGRVRADAVALDNHAGQQARLRLGFEHDSTVHEVFQSRMTREQFDNLYGSAERAEAQSPS
jgi:RimJ/RimL family protein N-acetyltransferase